VPPADNDHRANQRKAHSAPTRAVDDVLQKGGLAGTSCAEHYRLHHPRRVRPEPGLAMHVIAEDDRILRECGFDRGAVLRLAYK